MCTHTRRWSRLCIVHDNHEYALERLTQAFLGFLVTALGNRARTHLQMCHSACRFLMVVGSEWSNKQPFDNYRKCDTPCVEPWWMCAMNGQINNHLTIHEWIVTEFSNKGFHHEPLRLRCSVNFISIRITESFSRNCKLSLRSQSILEGDCIYFVYL